MTSFRATMSPACILFLVAFPCLAFAQSGKAAEKREYAELHHHVRANPDKLFESAIDWISSEGFVRKYGWLAMAENLKAPELKKDVIAKPIEGDETIVRDGVHRVRCLNRLGDQGWELVSIAPPKFPAAASRPTQKNCPHRAAATARFPRRPVTSLQ